MTQLEQNFLEAATMFCKYHYIRDNHNIKEIDWEQRRYEIAKAALVGQLASPIIEGIDPNPPMPQVAQWAVKFADALIEELKKTGYDDPNRQ